MDAGRKPSKRWLAVAFLLCLTGCLNILSDHLSECAISANKLFPNKEKAPEGEPFRTIEACMGNAGYEYNSEKLYCRELSYPTNVMEAKCYRPKSQALRVAFVLGDWFR